MKLRLDPTNRAAGLAFLTAFVTLFVQILVHRMVSAKLLNNYAFLVISLTMMGFAFSGVLLSRRLPWFLANLDDAITQCAIAFGITAIGISIVFYQIGTGAQLVTSRQEFVVALLQWIPVSLLFCIPFTCSGLILGALLSSPDLPTRRIYFFDLVGSAVGAFAAIPAISVLGTERSTLLACVVLLAGALLLARNSKRVLQGIALGTAVLLTVCMFFSDHIFVMRYPAASMLASIEKQGGEYGVEHIAWDPLARIEVSRIAPPDPKLSVYPSLTGDNPEFLTRFRRVLTQNNYAFTYAVDYDGNPETLAGIKETIYAAAYQATSVEEPTALVIGVGGGFDILTAIAHDASDVTGVEINAATVKIVTETYHDYFAAWVDDPRVHIIKADGRHHLATTDAKYDVIQLSGVDSYSGTPGAAHVFSENYLYTEEAFDLYLSHLTDNGIINMMRLEFGAPREMLRALTTAVQGLRRQGATDPSAHIIAITQTNGAFTAVLVKKSPFTAEELARVQAWADKSPYYMVTGGPGLNDNRSNPYKGFLALRDPGLESQFFAAYPFNVRPATDNKPFFFRYSYWWHLTSNNDIVRRHSIPHMEYSVIILGIVISLAAFLCIIVPLRYFASQGSRTANATRWGLYFAGTGLGYMAIEIAFLQKFGLFLGHPNYSLSVVLAALLLATGVGSNFAGEILRVLKNPRNVSFVLAAIVLLELGLAFRFLPAMIGLPFPVRTAIVFALVFPVGALLGTFIPHALDQLKGGAAPFVPWAWGINGIFSVLGPVVAVAWSISWGINALLLAAIPMYLVVGFACPAVAKMITASDDAAAA